MAERRMFAKTIIDSDAFIEMPMSARLLYYDLSMRADDDGFVNSPKKIMRMIGASNDDMNILIARKFVLVFENGVIVIKHWRIHNYIQPDRYKETNYKEQKALLELDENKAYRMMDTKCIQNVSNLDTQVRLGKDSIGKDKDNIAKRKPEKHKYGQYQHVLLTDEQLLKLKAEYPNYLDLITYLDEYIEMKGYKAKNHYLAIKKWVVDAVSREKNKMPDFNLKEPKHYTIDTTELNKALEEIENELRNKADERNL